MRGLGYAGGAGFRERGAAAGLVGRKGRAVWAGWASSGFFDCGRPKGWPPYAQNDGLWDLGLRWEAFGPEGRTRADSLREGQNRRKHKRKRWGERDGLFGRVGFFGVLRLREAQKRASLRSE
jgi:hypothetical protein